MSESLNRLTAPDGAVLTYESVGSGPGCIVVPGTSAAATDYAELAALLAPSLTVYLLNRRGRNGSSLQDATYSLQQECDDLAALAEQTGAPYVFGHSYGAFVALNAARTMPPSRLVVFEPPIILGSSQTPAWAPAFEAALQEGDYAGAYLIYLRGIDAFDPSWTEAGLRSHFASRVGTPAWDELLRRLPTYLNEVREVERAGSDPARYAAIACPSLLMYGTKSASWFQEGTAAIAAQIPQAELAPIAGQSHTAPNFVPASIATQIVAFLLNGD